MWFVASAEQLKHAMRLFIIENDRLDDAVARQHDIGAADLHALEHLEISGGMTPGQLGERLQLSSGTITALVDRLEAAGLLERAPHPSDRRSTMLCLTARAQAFAEQIYGPFGDDLMAATKRLNAAERATVTRFFSECAAVAADHAARQASSAASSSEVVTGRRHENRSQT